MYGLLASESGKSQKDNINFNNIRDSIGAYAPPQSARNSNATLPLVDPGTQFLEYAINMWRDIQLFQDNKGTSTSVERGSNVLPLVIGYSGDS
ncbi:predicted protein [Sclerotinia sclerotiorum 1980 UF-70]|uniref:Uncharacterized protein n=1 Tax=Sclerotinia sclerotiorum (strain ATCC 18683 / 1980 / Ss-1) TaxID=665079 RepID=A7EU09_SCLS1|nr:predicted protein [Sclerotinia sclerotiorum 1980 UF-70]EDN92951.1 predicted protein [Sclerotinia sclerotiorum 1980 UF-70]